MKFLDGWKTAVGIIGMVLSFMVDAIHVFPPEVRPFITGAFAMLTALGVVHKVEKNIYQAPPDD